MKKLLILTENPWYSPTHVGSHQIATTFLNMGWKVAYISKPISPFHVFGGITEELRNRARIYIQGGRHSDGLWTYVPFSFMTPHNKPLLSSRFVYENWHKMTFPSLKRKIRQAGFDMVDILYLDSAAFSFLLDEISYKRSLFRMSDFNKGFDSLSPYNGQKEGDVMKQVDYVFYTARALKHHIENIDTRNEPIFFPNGVNYEHFQSDTFQPPLEYRKLNSPIVVYVGTVKNWFDYELVKEIALERPNAQFVIIGGPNDAQNMFDDMPNIHCLGVKPYNDIPSYIRSADVGLIPFNRAYNPEFVDCINPLKLYEYMACGLPVVAREWKELKHINSPAYLYRDKEECLACLDKAIAECGARKGVYKAYAKAQSWDIRVKDMLKSIGMLES